MSLLEKNAKDQVEVIQNKKRSSPCIQEKAPRKTSSSQLKHKA
jgi:hypothetical protein